jgi:hypothetical protein
VRHVRFDGARIASITLEAVMSMRRWLALMVGLLLVGGAVVVYQLPELVRRAAVARIRAVTQRPVTIDRVELGLLRGRASIQGFHLADRDGQTRFADFSRLDVSLHWPSLLVGHLRVREVTLKDSAVHVVRLPDGRFNFSDLVGEEGGTGRPPNVTIERFVLTGGTVTLEDRALPEPRTWTSEQIEIDARNLSTRGDGGTAVARSVTAGAPIAIEMKSVRLHPVHLQATVTTGSLDLTLARVYLPADAPIVPTRGRLTTSMHAVLDARDGVHVDLSGQLEDVVLAGPGGGEPLVLAPRMTAQVAGFAFAAGALRLERLAIDGSLSVRDPVAKAGNRFRLSTVRATVADLTWPATTPGRLELTTSVPGGGTLAFGGTVRPPPDASDLRLRLAGVNLASWAQFLPIAARVTGVAEADLRLNEPLGAGIPARVHGSIALKGVGVADERHELLGARRIEASGIEVHPSPPARVVVRRVLVSEPRGRLERDAAGRLAGADLLARPASVAPSAAATGPRAAPVPPIGIEVGEVVVTGGAVAWRDQSVSPAARLDVSGIDARVTGVGWPLRGTAGVRVAARPPGGGQVHVNGRVGLDPPSAEVRVTAQNADLAPYRPYLPTTAHVAGVADLDVALAIPSLAETRATARGRAEISRVDVRDGERTVMRVERATATGLDVDWPRSVAVDRLALTQPWILVERDDRGELALRALIRRREACRGAACAPVSSNGESAAAAEPVAVTVARLTVDGGGARVVDQSVSPPFAVDLQSAAVKVDGLSTAGTSPARLDLSGRLGPGSELTLRGTVGPLGGPLKVDVNGELREFAVPRANPYMLRQAGWKSTEGRVTSKLQCRIDGDALSVKTDIRLSGLQIVRASEADGAQARIGLPLGMLTSLMKNRHGDIALSLPVGGRLDDPRFDFGEAVWGAVRAVAINAITLPVSWIGRVRFTQNSRIERIEVDPVTFQPGTPAPTAEGQTQITRLAAFLDQLPEVRLSLTPVVSSRDVEALKRRTVDAAIEQVARRQGLSRDAATVQLFAQRFADRPPARTPEVALATLVEVEPVSPAEIDQLAGGRQDVVRKTIERAGIAGERLVDTKPVQREGLDSRLEANVVEPETQRPSKVREALKRLGMPLKGAGAER